MARIKNLSRRGSRWRYRRVVPVDVVPHAGRRNWIHTFPKGADFARVVAEVVRLDRENDRVVAQARGRELAPEVLANVEKITTDWLREDKAGMYQVLSEFLSYFPDRRDMPIEIDAFVNAMQHGGRVVPEDLRLSDVYRQDAERHGEGRDDRTIGFSVESFKSVVGDADVRAIRRSDVTAWIRSMTDRGLAPATVLRRLGAVRAVVGRAYLEHDVDRPNPFSKHKVGGGARADDRLPFSREMLAMIDGHLARSRVGRDTRNMIEIMRRTGLGPAEVGGLEVRDAVLDGDVPFIWVRSNGVRGLKTASRTRRVPLVGDAVGAAEDAVAHARGDSLFHGYRGAGRGADSISAKLNKAIRAAGIPRSRRLTVYSFRHGVAQALREVEAPDHVSRRLLGHSGHGVHDRYGSPSAMLASKRRWLESALGRLGDVDPSVYGDAERIAAPAPPRRRRRP